MNPVITDTSLKYARATACILAAVLFAYYVAASLHWMVLWDGAVMHYIHFLITRGFHPYSDITDMNLPGSYLTEGWAMSVFGWGDISWRMYEYFLTAVLALSGMVIGGARHWMAGVYVALFFTLMHGAEGPMMAVERDEVMMVLLVCATAFFFAALRRQQPWLLVPFGFLGGFAASVKPGAILLDVVLIFLAYFTTHQQARSSLRFLLFALGGNLLAALILGGFLLQHHALPGLLFIWHNVLPSYAREKNYGSVYLLRHLTPVPLIPLSLAALVSASSLRRPLGWERTTLLLGVLTGGLSYWLQAKGYLYHRYVFVAFLSLWVGWELSGSQYRAVALPRILEVGGLALLFFVAAPFYVYRIYEYPRTVPPPQALNIALVKDLSQLGGTSLQNQVQCLDLVNGCLNALYRLRIVQSTGTTGDLLLFSPHPSKAVTYYREWFAVRELANPPAVVVLGNEWYWRNHVSFDKIRTWPEYAAYLNSHYTVVVERHFGSDNSPGYRIYLRDGSDTLAAEQVRPLR